jgi:hypothetical protein
MKVENAPVPPGSSEQSHTFFGESIAHSLILGSALFGIAWGLVNALLVSILWQDHFSIS